MAGDDDEMFMTRGLKSRRYVKDVTNNKRLIARRFVLLELTTDRHEASRGLFENSLGSTADRNRRNVI